MSPEHISVIPKFAKIEYISVLPIGPIFEIHIGPNLMWAKFGTTEMCSGLIDYNWLYAVYNTSFFSHVLT